MDNLGVGIKEDGKTIPTASSAFELIASHPKDPSNVAKHVLLLPLTDITLKIFLMTPPSYQAIVLL